MKNKIVMMMLALSLTVSVTACADTQAAEVTDEIAEDSSLEDPQTEVWEGARYLVLSEEEITLDGKTVTTDSTEAVYAANDIVYYEEGKDFTYGAGSEADAHSKAEADQHTVVHITQPGTYVVSGKLEAGQIAVDLGEEAEEDPEAVVTLVLDNAEINCSVAPAVIFYRVYECCSADEEEAVKEVDTSAAGANVLIADGSVNTVRGSYVAKIYKSVELNEDGTEVTDSKKLHKYDGAFYSKMSMNVNGGNIGDGILHIEAENEGLDSELHLTINGGNISIVSGNDGINTNEDNVSVTTINGGVLNIQVDGGTGEGDGIDSNGWIVINGGVVNTAACSDSMDAGIDSDLGIYINGGTVVATGNMYDEIAEEGQNTVVFYFSERIEAGTQITLKKEEESFEFIMPNDFTYLVVSNPELKEGTCTIWKGDEQLLAAKAESFGMGGPGRELPEGMEEGERPELPEGMKEGERPELPEGMEEGEKPEPPQGGFGQGEQISTEDAAEEFEITEGRNLYMVLVQ